MLHLKSASTFCPPGHRTSEPSGVDNGSESAVQAPSHSLFDFAESALDHRCAPRQSLATGELSLCAACSLHLRR